MTMLFNGTANAFVEACFNVPPLGMLYKAATLAALASLREKDEKPTEAAPTGPQKT